MSSARGSRRTGHRWLEPGQCLEECTHDFLGLRMAVAESSGLASRLGSLAIVQGEQARQGVGASERVELVLDGAARDRGRAGWKAVAKLTVSVRCVAVRRPEACGRGRASECVEVTTPFPRLDRATADRCSTPSLAHRAQSRPLPLSLHLYLHYRFTLATAASSPAAPRSWPTAFPLLSRPSALCRLRDSPQSAFPRATLALSLTVLEKGDAGSVGSLRVYTPPLFDPVPAASPRPRQLTKPLSAWNACRSVGRSMPRLL